MVPTSCYCKTLHLALKNFEAWRNVFATVQPGRTHLSFESTEVGSAVGWTHCCQRFRCVAGPAQVALPVYPVLFTFPVERTSVA